MNLRQSWEQRSDLSEPPEGDFHPEVGLTQKIQALLAGAFVDPAKLIGFVSSSQTID